MDAKLFLLELVSEVPNLRPIYEEHLRDNQELLAYPLMGAVSSFVVEHAFDPEQNGVIERILQVLDEGLKNHYSEVNELIGVEFIEILMTKCDVFRLCYRKAGPVLKQEMDSMLKWKAGG